MGDATRWTREDVPRGDAYDRRFQQLEAAGADVHGEAAFVASLEPSSVLDAGCGTGRVAAELARRGVGVVGVDLDETMLEVARRKAPGISWVQADLSTLSLGRRFDLVVMAGNVLLFTPPGSEAGVVGACARHLAPGGALVAGFQLDREYGLDAYDQHCAVAGLTRVERWATWDRKPFSPDGDYAVSVHRRAP